MKNVYRSYSLRAGVRSRVDWGRSLYRHSRWRLNSLLINDYNILVFTWPSNECFAHYCALSNDVQHSIVNSFLIDFSLFL